MATEFCPKCRKPRNLRVVTERRKLTAGGRAKRVETVSYHCESCNSFIRSEEKEVS